MACKKDDLPMNPERNMNALPPKNWTLE